MSDLSEAAAAMLDRIDAAEAEKRTNRLSPENCALIL